MLAILFVLYVFMVINIIREERARRWAYEHRDPDDQYWWSVDEWADYYYKQGVQL